MSSTADHRPDAGAPTPTPPSPPSRRSARPGSPRLKASLSPSLTCWDCDAQNPPDRLFCIACGTFIAVGSKAFSRRSSTNVLTSVPALVTSAGSTLLLGSYSVAMRRHEQLQAGRRRLLLGLVSAVLVTVVGVAAIHLATTPRGPAGNPAAALLVAPSAAPADESTPTPRPQPAERTQPAAAAEATPAASATARATDAAEGTLADAVTVKARATASAPASAGQGTTIEPALALRPEPAPTIRPEPALNPDGVTGATAEARPSQPRAQNRAVWRNGWVCDGELTLADPRLRAWTIKRASFLPGSGYERVVLNLERAASGSRSPATVRAEAFPTSSVTRQVSRVRQPSAGRSTVALQLASGIRSDLKLRSYRPKGLRTIKELSIYPVGRGSARVLVSAAADGCFKVRVPAWNGPPDARKAQVYIDVRQ